MAVPPVAQAGPTTSMPDKLDAVSLHAHLLESVKDLPSGRPGNMTAEQEASLKEMWIKLLDIFGVRKASTDASTAADAAPGRKEKKASGGRSGFSFWGGSKEAATDDANGAEGDKHGVNKAYREALDTMSPEQLRDEFWKMVKSDAPDAAVLRFLSARKWDPQAGVAMLISALRWRAVDMQVDDVLLVEGEAGALKQAKDSSDEGRKKESEDFMAQLRMGKSFLHAVDKQGRPCNYVRVRLHKGGEQSASSIEKFTVFLIETARLTAAPGADTATIVFDMTGFSMANMDYTPVKFMIRVFEANYPNTLASLVVYRAPWIFHGIWGIIKGWLDPVVAAKVHFASNVNDLSEYIERSNIIKEMDGDNDFVYSYREPVEGENAAMADTATRDKLLHARHTLSKAFDTNTTAWIDGKDVAAQRTKLNLALHLNYFQLDPYIRARSMYDRLGMVNTHNQLGWDPATLEARLKAAS